MVHELLNDVSACFAAAPGHDHAPFFSLRSHHLSSLHHAPLALKGLSRHDQVLSIDLVGPTMAYVKLKCAIPPRFFTDQLSLLKIDGRWQIAQKVFMTELRE